MAKTLLIPALTYLQLVGLIKKEISDGQKIIQQTQAEKYWKIGQAISEYVLNGKDRAKYGAHVLENLSKSLNRSVDTLERAVKFYREFPISAARRKLPWTHFRELLALPDPIVRQELMDKARWEGLTSREFKELVKKKKVIIPTDGPIAKLKVVRGQLYTYKIVEDKASKSKDSKRIDCGFDVSYTPPSAQLAKFVGEQIIETTAAGKVYSVHTSVRKASDLHTFKASVLKVVDGDTLSTLVGLGFGVWKKHKLRLRGIDTPEIDTPEGKKADAFVKERIGQCAFVVIKTYRDDKYGRYLVDVFYLIGEKDPAKVAAEGTFLNQELLDNRLAVKWH